LRGDEIVDDLVNRALADAFFQARAPRVLPYVLTPGSDGEPTSITILDDKSERLSGQVGTLALLYGGRPEAQVEVNVVWQPTYLSPATQVSTTNSAAKAKPASEAQAMPSERPAASANSSFVGESKGSWWRDWLAFPNDKHPDSLVVLDTNGSCLIPLVMPASAAEHGVVFKYCGHRITSEGTRRLVTLGIMNPTRGAIRTSGSVGAAKGLDAMSEGSFELGQHQGAFVPSGSMGEGVPVSVGAASFRWSG
jgi:hypothetical protein